jgi:ribose 1,5-bisphosphokinase PhnN
MAKVRASDVGFCVVDANADVIADNLIHRIRETAVEMEAQVNRLYRGRQAYDLSQGTKADLDKAIEQLTYMARTLRQVHKEQSKVVYLQAAE